MTKKIQKDQFHVTVFSSSSHAFVPSGLVLEIQHGSLLGGMHCKHLAGSYSRDVSLGRADYFDALAPAASFYKPSTHLSLVLVKVPARSGL